MQAALAAELAALEALSRRRDVAGIDARAAAGPSGRAPHDFTSNDYLGLATEPRVVQAAQAALAAHGAGGRAARLLGGGSVAPALEALVAQWLDCQAALLFPTGYQANVGLITSLAGPDDVLFSDALNHASLIDGMRLTRARRVIYPHVAARTEAAPSPALAQLEHALARAGDARRRLIVTESVFSMDGDLADLDALNELAHTYDAWLLVDEAHATGLLGDQGRGAVQPHHDRVLARVITGGKSLGSAGALIAGSQHLIDVIANRARSFIFTTAPPPSLPASLHAAVELVRAEREPAERCRANAARLAAALDLPAPAAAIVPIPIGPEHAAVAAMEALAARGFDLRAVRPPTVPPGTCRLRAVCHAWQTEADIDALATELRPLLAELQATAASQTQAQAPTTFATARTHARTARTPTLFVAGTDTDAGKTVAAALLCRAFTKLRGGVHYWKPVQTGSDSDSATVARLAALAPHQIQRPAWHLAKPASPHEAAADEGVTIQPARVAEGLDGLRRNLPAPLVVELAGGLLVPFTTPAPDAPPVTQLDWLAAERLPFVLVARSGLGTLNHTLLSLEALRARHLAPRALLLLGPPHPSNATTLAAWTGLPLIQVPHFDPLDTAALDAYIERERAAFEALLP